MTNLDVKNPRRELRYTVTPRATKNYVGDASAYLDEDIESTETILTLTDTTSFTEETYITINDEEMFIESITGNNIKVQRGKDGTIAVDHVKGSGVNILNAADDALIEVGDDFGFNETTSFFQDFSTDMS